MAEFNRRSPRLAASVVRFLPFEVPGGAAPRYRVNLLFFGAGDTKKLKLVLEEWYFRSPN